MRQQQRNGDLGCGMQQAGKADYVGLLTMRRFLGLVLPDLLRSDSSVLPHPSRLLVVLVVPTGTPRSCRTDLLNEEWTSKRADRQGCQRRRAREQERERTCLHPSGNQGVRMCVWRGAEHAGREEKESRKRIGRQCASRSSALSWAQDEETTIWRGATTAEESRRMRVRRIQGAQMDVREPHAEDGGQRTRRGVGRV